MNKDLSERIDEHIDFYLSHGEGDLRKLPREKIRKTIYKLEEVRWKGKKVFLCGNGGSASTANHFAADLHKTAMALEKPSIHTESLCANQIEFSAWANDTSFENVFVGMMEGKIKEGDVLIGISGSGKSQNVLGAINKAKTLGATTIGFTGFDGGRLKDIADICIIVPINNMEKIESVHVDLHHLITYCLKEIPAKVSQRNFEILAEEV